MQEVRDDWWFNAFPRTLNASERKGHPRGADLMYCIITYDISDPKRLKKAADCCLNYGVRVQLSVFECRIPADAFEALWEQLCDLLDPAEDKLVVYPMHGAAADKIRTYGKMVCSDQVVAYVF